MQRGNTAQCPQCGREVPVHANRFGDVIFSRHKMAVISTNRISPEVGAEFNWKPNINPLAAPIWEIDCPMSGQPLEE